MGALTIPAADASAAPAAAPAGGRASGASGFGTALAALLGGAQLQGPAPASVPDPGASGADASGEAGPRTPAALLGAAAGLAALLGRGATSGVGAPAQTVQGAPADPGAAVPQGAPSTGAVPGPSASPDGASDAAPAADPAVLAAVGDARNASGGPAHRRDDDAVDQQDAAAAALQAGAAAPVPLTQVAQPPVAPPTGAKGSTAVAAAVVRRTGSAAATEPAIDVALATTPGASTKQDSLAAADPAPAAPVDRSSAPAPAAQLAQVAPAQQSAHAAPVAAPAPVVVATTDPTIAQQLQGPLLSLRTAPEGEHVLVVRVTPDHLGPVTVHATVSHGDLSVQLFAASSDARDALSAMLTGLRQDLGTGSAGSATTLSLGTGDAPQQDGRGQQAATTWFGSGGSNAGRPREDRVPWSASPRAAETEAVDRPILSRSTALLDVLA